MNVSHLIDDSDEGQDAYDAMHPDQLLHIARAFAHKAGVGKNPGKYTGPEVKAPEGWDAPDEGQDRAMHQSQTLDNLASGGPANTTPPKAKPSDKVDFSSLGE